jgi:hypothetical protein
MIGEIPLLATVTSGIRAELPAEMPVAHEAEATIAVGAPIHDKLRTYCTGVSLISAAQNCEQ